MPEPARAGASVLALAARNGSPTHPVHTPVVPGERKLASAGVDPGRYGFAQHRASALRLMIAPAGVRAVQYPALSRVPLPRPERAAAHPATRRNEMSDESQVLEEVKRYYGEVLQSTADLQTGACCTAESMPAALREIVTEIHPEVRDRFYGCGSPIPPAVEGATVLDLGCGTGRDCYLLSRLVGPQGRVIGLDMTEGQLEIARRHQHYHAERFGHEAPNTSFVTGYIEDLAGAGIADGSVDVVVSNCVLNLSPDKERVFREIFRVLKPGGELYFSDVFASRRVPDELARDPVLRGECLGGALYTEDFRRLMARVGCADHRVCSTSAIPLDDPEIERKLGMIGFYSMTIRAFKLELEDRCEDYGQIARYRGSIEGQPHGFHLDDHHYFETGRPMPVCGNTADMLAQTRYAPHFEVIGDKSVHYGLFDCAPASESSQGQPGSAGGSCC